MFILITSFLVTFALLCKALAAIAGVLLGVAMFLIVVILLLSAALGTDNASA